MRRVITTIITETRVITNITSITTPGAGVGGDTQRLVNRRRMFRLARGTDT